MAADVRPSPERGQRAARRAALLKLVAGMLGVDYDELRQRDEERVRRRLLWFGSAGLAAAAVFLMISVFAGLQWLRAERQLRTANARRLAVAAQNARWWNTPCRRSAPYSRIVAPCSRSSP